VEEFPLDRYFIPAFRRFFYISGGAGFLPSAVFRFEVFLKIRSNDPFCPNMSS